MRKLALHWQILIAIILAAIVGGIVFNSSEATGVEPALFGVRYIAIFDYIGTIFLNALKMIIVPLITSSIIVGVAGIGSGGWAEAYGPATWRHIFEVNVFGVQRVNRAVLPSMREAWPGSS